MDGYCYNCDRGNSHQLLRRAAWLLVLLAVMALTAAPAMAAGAAEAVGGEAVSEAAEIAVTVAAVTEAAVTDDAVLDSALELMGMFGMGVPGYGLALALLALMMKLTKWGRTRSLFNMIPRRYRSLLPLGLGGLIGVAEGLATGLPPWQALIKGVVAVGGGQQLLYEQVKGTGLGSLIEAVTAFIPKPNKAAA